MNDCKRPIILTFINNYLPGYKAGGIPRSMINTVENLCNYVDFRIVTRDRDLGDTKTYENIRKNQWQPVGSAIVYYLSPQSSSFKNIKNLILMTDYDVLYLNSFFDIFTIKILLIRYFSRIFSKPVIVAPRGEFARSALKLKYLKKFTYIRLARIIGLYKNVTWHASSEFEEVDIMNIMKINKENIHNALDLPTKLVPGNSLLSSAMPSFDDTGLKIVFISRIARVKNLDLAIRILSKVKARVCFDIYGPLEDTKYWRECQILIDELPGNIRTKYLGIVHPAQIVHIFSCYDLFLFPTGGENYGHVIAESLTSGTPVLISDKTPWRNLRNSNLGWDLALDKIDSYIEVIEKCALMSIEERLENRASIKSYSEKNLLDPVVLEAHRQLFFQRIS
jgi:glycosyltransferase involved in cell wall biosynthesis